MTTEEREAQATDMFSYLKGCIDAQELTKIEAWDILEWYATFVQKYSEYIGLIECHCPQEDPDIGFRFVLDDGDKFLEVEYNEGGFTYYFRDRTTEWDREGTLNDLGQLNRFLKQLEKKVQVNA